MTNLTFMDDLICFMKEPDLLFPKNFLFFFLIPRPPPISPLFPYPTLSRPPPAAARFDANSQPDCSSGAHAHDDKPDEGSATQCRTRVAYRWSSSSARSPASGPACES